MTPARFRFTPMMRVIAIGCIASVVSVACIVAVALAVQRKRAKLRRHLREQSNDESKTAIGLAGDTSGGGCNEDGTVTSTTGNGSAVINHSGGDTDSRGPATDRHYHRADASAAVDDGTENNPDIIPHDNGTIN